MRNRLAAILFTCAAITAWDSGDYWSLIPVLLFLGAAELSR